MRRKSLIVIILLALILAIIFMRPELKRFASSSEVMSTLVTITVVSDSKDNAETAIDAAFDAIRALETSMSFWTKTSEIAEINAKAGIKPVPVSVDTFELASIALSISNNTSGAFDPTIGPLIRLWDYREAVIPSADALAKAGSLVDYRKIILNPAESSVLLSEPGMSFDTGGIAKGYAADIAVGILKSHGINSGLVTIAGDIRAFGAREDGQPWKVGVRDPRGDSDDAIIAILELNDEAVSTSGDYERFFVINDKRYHHLLDPDTGYPSEGTMSFTVIAPLAVLTDGYATGAFVLGPEKGLEAIKKQGLEGMAISTDGEVFVTEGLRDRMEWVSERYELAR